MIEILSPTASVAGTVRAFRNHRSKYRCLWEPTDGPTDGRYVDWEESSLSREIVLSMRQKLPDGLYRHQHVAIENALSNKNTVVATRTSSGKSLTFALPALDAILGDPSATTLFLYPQKALANDQFIKLREMVDQTDLIGSSKSSDPFFVSSNDGGTPQDDRKEIRQQVRMMLANPDMLRCRATRSE